MMRLRRPAKRPKQENTIPLINVVFLLLIFFMLAGRLGPSDPFPLQMPISQVDVLPEDADRILYVSAQGDLHFLGQPHTLDTVSTAVATSLSDQTAIEPFKIKADHETDASYVMRVVAALGQAGVTEAVLLTELPRSVDGPTVVPIAGDSRER